MLIFVPIKGERRAESEARDLKSISARKEERK